MSAAEGILEATNWDEVFAPILGDGGGGSNNGDKGYGGDGGGGSGDEWSDGAEYPFPYAQLVGAGIGSVIGVAAGIAALGQLKPSSKSEGQNRIFKLGLEAAKGAGSIAVMSALGAAAGYKIQKQFFPSNA